MDQLQFYQQFGITLDLALEAHDLLRGDTRRELPGVSEEKESFADGMVTTVTILNEVGANLMGRPQGTYITIEAPRLRENNPPAHVEIGKILAVKLRQLIDNLQVGAGATVLLIGMGNWEATPDALGPRVIDHCLVTRHLHQYAPEELEAGLRPVAAVTPGVLGLTGIETAEIARGVAQQINPDLIIVIDALAAQSLDRISTTIQMADTGISPGSGVGNQRSEITRSSTGVPVIAIGVPTVVHAAVIVFEAMRKLTGTLPQAGPQLTPQAMQDVAAAVLAPFGGELTVTPKEIDDLIQNTARVLADGINQGLHPSVAPETFDAYLH